jgi:RNA polymerase sigma factor (TIGR02999 family)
LKASLFRTEVTVTDITRVLQAIEEGDGRAIDQLLPAVYEELRQLAARKLAREKPGHTLQPTALVHEAYLRLVGQEGANWKSRTHFFAAVAEAMRRILIENARRKHRLKRQGDRRQTALEPENLTVDDPPADILALDEALTRLAEKEPAVADLVKLRYFAGLTIEEAAEVIGIAPRTAHRYWSYARAWLFARLAE